MSKAKVSVFLLALFFASTARPDTIILQDGASYSGQFVGVPGDNITFTDTQGIKYNLPQSDVQSIVFTSANDIITLRNGKVYSGTTRAPIPSPSLTHKASVTNSL